MSHFLIIDVHIEIDFCHTMQGVIQNIEDGNAKFPIKKRLTMYRRMTSDNSQYSIFEHLS